MKINELKHVPVGYVNTPLEYMPALTKKLGKGKLYIKRDDMTGLALGGNKARKLDYIVKYALDNGYTALMTFGGNQTNHGRLTVAAAIRYGLKPILILKGSKPEYMSGNVLLDRLMGADIYFADTSAADALPEAERNAAKKKFVDACAEKVIAEYAARGEKVLSVPVGGQTVVGSAGYVQAVPEIMRQMEAQGIDAKYLVVGYGSTGTFAGLWAGAKYYNAPFEVIGIPIEPDYRPVAETVDFINELSRTFELGISCKEEDLHIEYGEGENFYGGVGYNEPGPYHPGLHRADGPHRGHLPGSLLHRQGVPRLCGPSAKRYHPRWGECHHGPYRWCAGPVDQGASGQYAGKVLGR